MADASTPNFNFTLPSVGGSEDSWGDKLNANWSLVDSLLRGLAPIGTILMFDGTAGQIPAGWASCDGTNGTPDLRDKFLISASVAKPQKTSGGAFTITDVPAHTHAVGSLATSSGGGHDHGGVSGAAGAHNHGAPRLPNPSNPNNREGGNSSSIFSLTSSVTLPTEADHTHAIAEDGAHSHTITGSVASTGQTSVNITPPYYAVIYIRRMS